MGLKSINNEPTTLKDFQVEVKDKPPAEVTIQEPAKVNQPVSNAFDVSRVEKSLLFAFQRIFKVQHLNVEKYITVSQNFHPHLSYLSQEGNQIQVHHSSLRRSYSALFSKPLLEKIQSRKKRVRSNSDGFVDHLQLGKYNVKPHIQHEPKSDWINDLKVN